MVVGAGLRGAGSSSFRHGYVLSLLWRRSIYNSVSRFRSVLRMFQLANARLDRLRELLHKVLQARLVEDRPAVA